MDEKEDKMIEIIAREDEDKGDLHHVAENNARDEEEARKPQPQYDSFMRIIRR